MQLEVDAQSPISIRRQLTEQVEHFIDAGSFPRKQALPSIRQLASTQAANPTDRRASHRGPPEGWIRPSAPRHGDLRGPAPAGSRVDRLLFQRVWAPTRTGPEERTTMEEQRTSYAYRQFTVTTLRHEGVWWAKARVAEKDVGGDRPVVGGPWKSQSAARVAAEAFCDGGKAG